MTSDHKPGDKMQKSERPLGVTLFTIYAGVLLTGFSYFTFTGRRLIDSFFPTAKHTGAPVEQHK